MIPRVSSTERVVCDEGDVLGIGHLPRVDVDLGLHQHDVPGRLPHGALDLLVAVVADQHDRVALRREAARLDVHLRHERARGVDRPQLTRGGVLVHDRCDAMGGEDRDGALRNLALGVDEDRAALAQLLDHMLVVDDLLAHVDRRPVQLQGALDRLHRPIDPGAVSAGGG